MPKPKPENKIKTQNKEKNHAKKKDMQSSNITD